MRRFRITIDGTSDSAQIHTDRSYSAFNDTVEAVAALTGRAGIGPAMVNPDCGLEARGRRQTEPAQVAMVDAARVLRATHALDA